MTEPATPEELRARLETLAVRRGFLLPHHGALAAGAPDLHAAYLAMYEALTVRPGKLSPLERECVWLCLLVTAEEAIGTHHLELFRAAGGSDDMASILIALAGAAPACDAFDFAHRHWTAQFPDLDPAAAWDWTVAALRGPVAKDLADLCLLTAQAARGSAGGIARQLHRLYALKVDEAKIVEALSYVMWPKGVNAFVEACNVWHGLMVAGAVSPSELFAAWRDMPGLGAYDPASGAAVAGFQRRTMMTEAAAETLKRFLRLMESRDLGAASEHLAPGFRMVFPGGVEMERLDELVAWSRERYRRVRKTFERIESAGQAVWVSGTLSGEWLDGRPFEGIRYVDRFELQDGLIVRQDVWNDMGEAKLADSADAEARRSA